MTEPIDDAASPFQRVEFPPIPADHYMLNEDGWQDILATHVQNARQALGVQHVVAYLGVPQELLDDHVTINFRPPTPEEIAQGDERRARWQAEQDVKQAEAVAEWREVRARYWDSPAVLAVLDIHRPTDRMECGHEVFGYEAHPEGWPCSTYTAIKDAVAGE